MLLDQLMKMLLKKVKDFRDDFAGAFWFPAYGARHQTSYLHRENEPGAR